MSMMSEDQTPNYNVATTPFGARLQAARHAMGLETKDAAAQLRLNEQVILSIEEDCYATNLHPTFLRGYLRAYGKLLQIPEHEIKQALEPIKPATSIPTPIEVEQETKQITTNNYAMRIVTYVIAVTLVTLVAIWWYSHSAKSTQVADSTPVALPQTEAGFTIPMAPPSANKEPAQTANNQPAPTPSNIGTPVAAGVKAPSPLAANTHNDGVKLAKPESAAIKEKTVAPADDDEDEEE